jgi:hypothetical protein
VTSRPGSDWCRGRTRQAERNASARFLSKAIVTCDDCSSSAQHPSLIVLERDPTSIPGWSNCLGRRPTKVVAVGAGQQDGADRLGGVGQGRALSGANTLKQRRRPSGGLNRGSGLQGYVEDVEESRG